METSKKCRYSSFHPQSQDVLWDGLPGSMVGQCLGDLPVGVALGGVSSAGTVNFSLLWED